jgi:hypothetical protein
VIPLQDLTPRRSFPVVTLLLILANTLVFLYQISLPPHAADAFIMTYGVVPYKIQMAIAGRHYSLQEALLPLFTCMFLHGGWLHILGNMWFHRLPALLFGLRNRFQRRADTIFLGLAHSIAGRERRDLRRARRLHRVLPQFANFHADHFIHPLVPRAHSGTRVHRPVVRDAISQRDRFAGYQQRIRIRRRGVVGACRRISTRYADRIYNVT